MSLRDQACYTLQLQPSSSDPAVLELVEVEGVKKESRYARVREGKQGEAYSSSVFDYLTGAKLASVGYETDKAKRRRLQLHGPDEDIAFDFTGKINFWTFQFQGHKFRWSKEVYGRDYVCSMDRKPDPKVEICLARGPDKADTGRIQILHYNIERFPDELTDLRGLETLLITSFMCFVDVQDDRWKPAPTARPSATTASSSSSVDGKQLPPVPVKPEKVVSEEDFEPENPNEILVGMNSNIDNHIAKACHLLMDPKVLYVVVKTRQAEAAQRALEVSLGVKRFRHHEGLGDVYQYVVDEEETKPVAVETPKKAGPKVISLDDPKSKPESSSDQRRKSNSGKKPEWKPPSNIIIYISTIDIPELHPSRRRASNGNGTTSSKPAVVAPTLSPSGDSIPGSYPAGEGNGAKLKKSGKGFLNPFSSSSKPAGPGEAGGGGGAGAGANAPGNSLGHGTATGSKPGTSPSPSLKPTKAQNGGGKLSPTVPASKPTPKPAPPTAPPATPEQNQQGESKASGGSTLARLIAMSKK